jgi:hypothetical protein
MNQVALTRRPVRRPYRGRLIPPDAEPLRRLAAAIICNALEEYIFPRRDDPPFIQFAARQFLISPEGQGLCLGLGIPASKIARLRRGELKRYWAQLVQ